MITAFHKVAIWVLMLVAAAVLGWIVLQAAIKPRLVVGWTVNKDALRITSSNDGPWVVTHLLQMRPDSPHFAQLPVPITIVESGGGQVPRSVMESLSWVDRSGAQVKPPQPGALMSAFYFVPEQAQPSDYAK